MPLLVNDEAKDYAGQVSADEIRVIRLLRLLGEEENRSTFSSLCIKAAAILVTRDSGAELEGEEVGEEYLIDLANRAIPLDDDIFRLLLDHGCLDEWRGAGALWLMEQPLEDVDDIARDLVSAYRMLADENPAYASIDRLYPRDDPGESAKWFHEAMMATIDEWRERFLTRLEAAVTAARMNKGAIDAR